MLLLKAINIGFKITPLIISILSLTALIGIIKMPSSKVAIFKDITFRLSFGTMAFFFLMVMIILEVMPQVAFRNCFKILQLVLFIGGIVFTAILYEKIDWSKRNRVGSELLYTLALVTLAAVIWLIAFSISNKIISFQFAFLRALPIFILPITMLFTYDFWTEIPTKKFKGWILPLDRDTPVIEFDHTIHLDLFIKIDPTDEQLTKVPIRVPLNKKVGEVFHYLVLNYNASFPEAPIQLSGSQNQLAYTWLFKKKGFPLFGLKSVQPELTFEENSFKHDGKIIISRAEKYEEEVIEIDDKNTGSVKLIFVDEEQKRNVS